MSKIDEVEYRPRFSFDITQEQQERAFRLLNLHGMRRAIMSLLLDEVLDLIEEHGHVVVGILIERAARPRDIIPGLKEAQMRGSNGNHR